MLEASHTYGFEGSHDGVFGSLGVTQFECSADIDCGSLAEDVNKFETPAF